MEKANNALYIHGEYMVLTDKSDESIQSAEKCMQDRAVQFLKDKGVLQIITHRDDFKGRYFSESNTVELVASVGWKLNMNPLLKEPDLNEQPVPKLLSMFLNELGCELRESVDAVFQRSKEHSTTISEMYASTVTAINAVIGEKIDANQGRLIR